ncbi:MAG: PEP-CTERM sorting domain-containing protein [Verrucomicrobiaceae bacterium]|nr:MAG: PEP-CTERM sorting domain-containing protein [Verrucomicrobiaceae bacterium]
MKFCRSSKVLSAALTTFCLASPLQAAVTTLGSYTKTTDGSETFTNVFGGGLQMFNHTSGNVYVVLQTTFTNPVTPGTLDTSESYGGYGHSDNDLFGQLWQSPSIGVAYYGERSSGVTIPVGSPVTLVIKYELNGIGLDGDTVKFWVNPTLGTGVEGTPNDADPIRLWEPASISSDDMRFRRGNSSDNQIEFSNVTVYDGGSSPFAVVPEPSAALLAGLGLVGYLRRRNR